MNDTDSVLVGTVGHKWSDPAPIGSDSLLSHFESLISPLALSISLLGLAYFFEERIRAEYLLLAGITFFLTFPGRPCIQLSAFRLVVTIFLRWIWVAGLLMAVGFAARYSGEFWTPSITAWIWVAPLVDLAACVWLQRAAATLLKIQGPPQRAMIVGYNEQGVELANRISQAPYGRLAILGFVDNRCTPRIKCSSAKMLGTLSQLANVVKRHHVQIIYISMPMVSQPRILQLLDELKDTTASVYFVPDMFVTDLIQGRTSSVCGTPVISVCETPFKARNGVIKRLSDIVFSLFILALILPVMILIAVAIKIESRGPVIFRQRRYGLDGEEIVVYKFRSMTVTEDGENIQQAQANDTRITRLGAILRKTSLDELPQFINVLQGRMSIVGPRPHAVAHNELYRKLIKGYMVRHKVRPGITGWAQVNGYRGETQTLDKMKGRVEYDLDYLRHWSLRLDVIIILKTIRLVLKDQNAY